MIKELEKQREQVKQIETKIFSLVGTKDPGPVNDAMWNMRVDDYDKYNKIVDLLLKRKRLLDKMFRGTDSEYQRLCNVNNLLKDKTIEIDEISETAYKCWTEGNGEWVEDARVWVRLGLPMEHIEYDVNAEEREFYGSDISSMINLECVINTVSSHLFLRSFTGSESNARASELHHNEYDLSLSPLQSLDADKSGRLYYRLYCLEYDMNFPRIDIIHMNEFRMKIEMNTCCKA